MNLAGSQGPNLHMYGVGRAPLDLLRIPWQLTFFGDSFSEGGRGEIGVALLLALPLVLLGPGTRMLRLLSLLTLGSLLGWAYTAQYTRYLLPTLAVLSAICGIGIVNGLGVMTARGWRVPRIAVMLSIVVALCIAPFLYLPAWRSQLPIDLITGKESFDEYIDRVVPAAEALAAATDLLPENTPVGFIGIAEGAQIYTEALLEHPNTHELGTTSEEVLRTLNQEGIHYIVWSRIATAPEDWRSTLLSTDFLEEHARILHAGNSGYLLEILPEPGAGWRNGENLLDDPGLKLLGPNSPWVAIGPVAIQNSSVVVEDKATLVQRVPVSGGEPYLFTAFSKCSAPDAYAVMALRWHDEHAVTLDVTWEKVVPGTAFSDQFIWHRAPDRAAFVDVSLSIWGPGNCTFRNAALYSAST